MWQTEEWDPRHDPAPDVLLEVDISRSSMRKREMFAQFGVGELWRHDGERMTMAVLDAGTYRPAPASRALPPLTADGLTELLAARARTTLPAWVHQVRAWAQRAADVAGS